MQALPSTMHAVKIIDAGAEGSLSYEICPTPSPKPHEILVRVHAAGVNHADLFQVKGTYPFPSEADGILGLEFAGEVAAIGADVTRWLIGDRVCGIVTAGGYADYVTVHADHTLPIPSNLDMEQAACLPEALATSYLALFILGHAAHGQTALIHGGSSGIGTIAIQMLRHAGLEVFATAGNDAKCQACETLGATAVNYKTQDFVEIIKQETEGRGVDIVLDMVGGSYVQRNLRSLALGGRLISIAFLEDATINANMAGLLMKEITWRGMRLRSQTDEMKARIMREIEATFLPAVAEGQISPVLECVYPLKNAEKAHAQMQEGLHIGKIVLSMVRFPNM
jgi:NADPH2:quinone reductase